MSIKTILIDDNEECLFDLHENLALIPGIEIVGEASQYKKAKSLLLHNDPDLIFLDIEMPYKNGFELLDEVYCESKKTFKVIFYTAYDKYTIEALRKSAFDYILKPAKFEEIKKVIERYREDKEMLLPSIRFNSFDPNNRIIAMPVNVGLKFLDINSMVYAQCDKEIFLTKPGWEVILTSFDKLKLRKNTTANNLLSILGKDNFIQINRSALVNKNYIGSIEYKTKKCVLIPPFNSIDLTISRIHLNQLKERFDEF